MYSFRKKVVFINGGSRGLGFTLACQVAREGARVFLTARNQRELEESSRRVYNTGALAVDSAVCNVSQAGSLERAMEQCRESLGPVDVLFNVASIIQVGPWESMGENEFREAMEINLWGTYRAIEAVLPDMIARRNGRIMNITSIGGAVAVPHLLPYTVAKFAARGLSEGLRVELAQYGIKVTTVIPGLMRTGSFLNALFKGERTREFTWFSLGSSLPIISMSAPRAARQMIQACRLGRGEIVVGLPAKTLRILHDLFPNFTLTTLAWINRLLLPKPVGKSDRLNPAGAGKLYHLPSLVRPATTLGDRAADRLIEKRAI